MSRRFFSRRTAIALGGVFAAAALATAAMAYFLTTGSGTGQASVGNPTSWSAPGSITFQPTTGTVYPGVGTSTVHYTITNVGGGHQYVQATTATVASDGSGNITDGGTAVPGCLSTWFSVTNNGPAPVDLAPGGATTGSADVTMANAGTSQNACMGHHPDIVIGVS
jgi:hypothetical protein